LPWTELSDGATVQITTIDDNGNEITGDTITAVVLQIDSPQIQTLQLQKIVEMPAATAV